MSEETFSDEETAAGRDWENLPTESGAAAHTDVLTGTGLDNGGEYVLVYPGPNEIAQTAKALNDAAPGRENEITWTDGAFRVPKDIAEGASLPGEADAVIQPRAGSTSTLNGAEGDLNGEHRTPARAGSTEPTGSTEPAGAPAPAGSTEPEGDTEQAKEDDLSGMTVAELGEYADKNKIDLGGATRKADIQAAIREHRRDHPEA